MDDYGDFAIDTAKRVAEEETDKLLDEVVDDVRVLMDKWAATLIERIDTRMDELGIEQELTIKVTWNPVNMPEFEFFGATNSGVTNG